MKIFLESALSKHRHGRFFSSQLNAVATEILPECGLVMVHGKIFKSFDEAKQAEWWAWSSQPGCSILLLPPFDTGKVCQPLDWTIALGTSVFESEESSIASIVADEVTAHIIGKDGEFERSSGHQWSDFSINTRYFKKHSASGIFAVSCLPLWSISLMDDVDACLLWLQSLQDISGSPGENVVGTVGDSEVELSPTDYTVLVCSFAFDVSSASQIMEKLKQLPVTIVVLEADEITESVLRLSKAGLLSDDGLSEAGEFRLQRSPYWVYAESLQEEVQQ